MEIFFILVSVFIFLNHEIGTFSILALLMQVMLREHLITLQILYVKKTNIKMFAFYAVCSSEDGQLHLVKALRR